MRTTKFKAVISESGQRVGIQLELGRHPKWLQMSLDICNVLLLKVDSECMYIHYAIL